MYIKIGKLNKLNELHIFENKFRKLEIIEKKKVREQSKIKEMYILLDINNIIEKEKH